ncbi:MAG TPA: hypothetical protein VFX17_03290 [Patescibacteria group bacterium]|nr:hypothetical protein [Patescibacteria group bacterium]
MVSTSICVLVFAFAGVYVLLRTGKAKSERAERERREREQQMFVEIAELRSALDKDDTQKVKAYARRHLQIMQEDYARSQNRSTFELYAFFNPTEEV